ncbi:uncharacterized protein C9orf57-like isoform X3 [Sceloporus undulatus]|uniref:uncharacterized protein C9orf57-like isoform X3 n=1 Tax=Sceloporus undulatus TaxID=8520 RepID=UPI001C4BD6BA|nr:uncharacterized protein C9orf57-like isoform X3 [Sceloporus undulatus]
MLHLSSHMDFFRTDFLLSSELILKAARGSQALTCHDCKKYNRVHGCLLWKQQTCEAVSGQQCKIVSSFLGDIRGYMSQGCTRSVAECGATQFHPVLGSQYTSCCNDHDFCNV